MIKKQIVILILLLAVTASLFVVAAVIDKRLDQTPSRSLFPETTAAATAQHGSGVDPDETEPTSSGTDDPQVTTRAVVVPTDIYTSVPVKNPENVNAMSFTLVNDRLDEATELVLHYRPGIFGVNRASRDDLEEFAGGIDGYLYFGNASSAENGLYNSIFFDSEIYEIIKVKDADKAATIWLTGTPEKESKHAEAAEFATCTYALLKNKETEETVAVFNASMSDNAGKKGAEAATEREILALYSKYSCYISYFPTIVMGSFPFEETDPAIGTLTDGGKLNLVGKNGQNYIFSNCFRTNGTVSVSATDLETSLLYADLTAERTPYKIDVNGKMVALTFDDGPCNPGKSLSNSYTNKILETLEDHKAKATFFVLGERLTAVNVNQRSLTQRAFFMGCEIGNHTYDHTTYRNFSSVKEAADNLAKNDKLIAEVCGGIRATLLRPPTGQVKTIVDFDDRPLVNWSVDTEDWMSSTTPDLIFETVKRDTKDKSIVLMHDINQKSPEILDSVITNLQSRGFQCVTVSELMEFNNVQMTATHIYVSGVEANRTLYYA